MPLGVAEVVAGEQRLDRAEARRLDVDRARREREPLDVGDGVDRRVPGDAVAVRLERGVGLGDGQVGILEPRLGERLGDAAVEAGVGVDVDRRALVGALEVDRRDRAGRRRAARSARPSQSGVAVELEAQPRVDLEPARDRLEARRVAEPHRDDEADRPRLAPEHVVRASGRPGAARGPAPRSRPPSGGSGGRRACAGRRPGKRSSSPSGAQNDVERPVAGERQRRPARLLRALVLRVVGDVLAEALLAGAVEVERRGEALELRRDAGARGPRARSRRSSAGGRRAFVGGHAGRDISLAQAMTAALRFLVLIELLGLAALPLAAASLGRLPGPRRRVRQAARAPARDLARVAGRLARPCPTGLGAYRRRRRCWRRPARRVVARAAAAAGRGARRRLWSEGLALVAFAGMRCSSPTRPTSGRPRSRWTWRSSTPRATRATSRRTTRGWRARTSTTTTSATCGGWARAPHRRSSRTWATTSRVARSSRWRWRPRSRSRSALGGRAGAAGLWGVALCVVAGTTGAGLDAARATAGRCAPTTGSAPSRVIPDTINEFPAFSFLLGDLHGARDRGAVHAARARLRAAGRGRRAAAAPRGRAALELGVAALAIGVLYAINAWSFPVVAGLVASARVVRLRDAPARASAGAARVGVVPLRARGDRRAAVPAHLRRRRPRARVVASARRSAPSRATTARSTGCFA